MCMPSWMCIDNKNMEMLADLYFGLFCLYIDNGSDYKVNFFFFFLPTDYKVNACVCSCYFWV